MNILYLAAATSSALTASMDFASLDEAIEACRREAVLPVFSAEAQRRSAFITAAYQEQAEISGERAAVAAKRRALRELGLRSATQEAPKPGESDQELALAQLALDDRQRALDDLRRLETIRQNAVELKRQYFLSHCPSGKQKP